jgi:hypothetical protein
VHVEGLDAGPAGGVGAVAAEAFGYEGAGIGNVGETGVDGQGTGVVDEVVYWLCVGV